MTKTIIKLYAGDYVPTAGYPFVLIVSQWMRRTSEHGAEVYFITQQAADANAFKLDQTRINAELTRSTLDDWQMTDPEAFLEEEARDWARKHLAARRREPYESTGVLIPLREYELAEEAGWKSALLRLRLRGMSDEIVDRMKQTTESQELITFLHRLGGVQPIVVNSLPT